jgi:hypothetical protein
MDIITCGIDLHYEKSNFFFIDEATGKEFYRGHSSVELTVRRYAQRGGVEGKAKVNKLADVYNIH